MRYCFLLMVLFISLPALAQNTAVPQTAAQVPGILIRNIVMEGFVLGDKDQFIKIFKPYRNKYLTPADMDVMLQKIQEIYNLNGYQQLVSITYHVDRHRLIFTALMTS